MILEFISKSILLLFLSTSILFAKEITDQLGRKVEVPDKIERVVVLIHHALNVVVQLDGTNKVVGIQENWKSRLGEDFVKFAPQLEKIATPGDLKGLNFESLLLLKPDVVIAHTSMVKKYEKKFKELKIPVIAISLRIDEKERKDDSQFSKEEFSSTYGLYNGIEIIGDIFDKQEKAKELINYIKNSQKELKEKVASINLRDKDKTKVFLSHPNLGTVEPEFYAALAFNRAGANNVAKNMIRGKNVSEENVLAWNPQVIFVPQRHPLVVDELKNNKKISKVDAIKNNKIYIAPQYLKLLNFPTPESMALGEIWIAKTLYPEAFSDFDLDSKVEEYYKKFYRTSYEKK